MLYEVKLSIRAQSCAAQVPPLSTCIKETRGAVGVHVVPAGYMNCFCHQSQQLSAWNYLHIQHLIHLIWGFLVRRQATNKKFWFPSAPHWAESSRLPSQPTSPPTGCCQSNIWQKVKVSFFHLLRELFMLTWTTSGPPCRHFFSLSLCHIKQRWITTNSPLSLSLLISLG